MTLPSWRPGATRDSIVTFLDAAVAHVPPAERVAYFDVDGTLWCEKPTYLQYDFFVDALRRRAEADPSVADRAELAAVLGADQRQIAALGLPRIALALAGLFEGDTPEAFTNEVRAFFARASDAGTVRPVSSMVYAPMLELIDELRHRDFTVGLVTGGGTEFVRAVSADLFGVPPELVVGTLIGYRVDGESDHVELHRTADIDGIANEGAAKVANIQTQLGRRPILAAGNSAGDLEMLQWARTGSHPGFALLVDHDDAVREHEYASVSGTLTETEAITTSARRLGWTVVSMRSDWKQVFAAPAGDTG